MRSANDDENLKMRHQLSAYLTELNNIAKPYNSLLIDIARCTEKLKTVSDETAKQEIEQRIKQYRSNMAIYELPKVIERRQELSKLIYSLRDQISKTQDVTSPSCLPPGRRSRQN